MKDERIPYIKVGNKNKLLGEFILKRVGSKYGIELDFWERKYNSLPSDVCFVFESKDWTAQTSLQYFKDSPHKYREISFSEFLGMFPEKFHTVEFPLQEEGGYIVKISKDKLEVGCQVFTWDEYNALITKINEARKELE